MAVVPKAASLAAPVSTGPDPNGQVGEAFGVEQMRLDAEVLKLSSPEAVKSVPSPTLPIESALMIVSAQTKRIDVLKHLSGGADKNTVVRLHICHKFLPMVCSLFFLSIFNPIFCEYLFRFLQMFFMRLLAVSQKLLVTERIKRQRTI